MKYFCKQCHAPLRQEQQMCKCGQMFDHPVPEDDGQVGVIYWEPPRSSSSEYRTQRVRETWEGINPAVKAGTFGLLALVLIGVGVSGHHRPAHTVRSQTAAVPVVCPALPVQPSAPSMPAPIVLTRPQAPVQRNSPDSSSVSSPSLNPPVMDTSSQPTTVRQAPSVEPSSPYQTASTAASEAEQDNIQGAWSGGSPEEPQTQDIQATVESSAALNTMVTSMDEMAQSPSEADHLIELRERFNAIIDKAYGGSGTDPSLPATRFFLQAHPGLSQTP